MVRPVCLFAGNEAYLKERALKDLKLAVLKDETNVLDFGLYYAESANLKEVAAVANTPPFISPKRLVVLKGVEGLKKDSWPALLEYIKVPQKTTCLVLDTDESGIPPELQPVAHCMEIRRFDRLDDESLSRWVEEFAAAHGKRLAEGASGFLVESIGDDIKMLAAEVDKLAAYAGERDTITFEDIELLVAGSVLGSTFDLTDALGDRRCDEALRVVHDLIMAGRRYHEIVGLMGWHLKRALDGRRLLDEGRGEAAVASVLKVPEKFRKRFISQVRRFNREELEERLADVLRLDIAIKTSRADPKVLLEAAVVRLCL